MAGSLFVEAIYIWEDVYFMRLIYGSVRPSLRKIVCISNSRTLSHSLRAPRDRIRHIKVVN